MGHLGQFGALNVTHSILKTGMAVIAAFALSSCTTIRGSQDSLPELRPTSAMDGVDAAITNFSQSADSFRSGLSKAAYRDKIVRQYSQRIEGRYNSFIDQLYAGDRGTALGLDLLQLGLTGATGLVAPSAVDDLTTITAVAAAARATIDKRVFYDRTISAVVATMDARRTQVLADIARKRRMSASQYTLNDAFDDLNRLVDAGNVNRAFGQISRNAEADRATAEARLSNISSACENINVNDGALRQEFRLFIAASTANLDAAKTAMEVDVPAGRPPEPVLRDVFATNYCGNEAKRELLDTLKGVGGP